MAEMEEAAKSGSLSQELRKRLPSMINNVIKFAVLMIIIRFVAPSIIPSNTELIPNILGMNTVLNALSFLVIIYYGYYILRDIRALTDRAVNLVVIRSGIVKEGSALRRAAMDIVWTIGIILAYAAVMPLVKGAIKISWVEIAVALSFLLLIAIFLYDCVRMLSLIFGVGIKRLVNVIAGIVEKAEREVKEEGSGEGPTG